MKEAKLQVLYEQYTDCQRCPELCKSRSQVVFGYGSQNAKILAIGQSPGETEDRTGLPTIGPTGRILDYFFAKAYQSTDDRFKKLVKEFKIVKGFGNRTSYVWGAVDKSTGVHASHWVTKQLLAEHIFWTNAVLCYPEKDRKPEKAELDACRDRLLETIYVIDPVIIVAMGGIALEALFGKRGLSISSYKGKLMDLSIPGRQVEIKYPVMPIYHPSYLMRNPSMEEGSDWDITEKSISQVVSLVQEYVATNS